MQQEIESYLNNGQCCGNSTKYKEIPIDFFISTTVEGSHLTYLTDTYKTIDLQQYSSVPVINSNEIVRNGNDLFVIINWGGNVCIIAMYGCYIKDNILKVTSSSFQSINEDKIHGLIFHRNFLYASERPLSTDVPISGSNIVKINPYDLQDIKKLNIPYVSAIGGHIYNGYTTDILSYKNKLFVLISRGSTNPAYFLEIDENLNSYTEIFKCGHLDNSERVLPGASFIIYNDEIYIPTYSWIAGPNYANTIGLTVFDFSGNVKRKVGLIPISAGSTIPAIPHWFGIFNGKLIITFTNDSSENKGLVIRVDCKSLELEDTYNSYGLITDDNTIFRNGYVYLNQEGTSGCKLLKIKYNNFTDVTTEISNYNNGKGSYGSISTTNLIDKESFNSYNIPVITSAEMTAMTNPIPAIYLNSTTGKLVFYNGTNWSTLVDS